MVFQLAVATRIENPRGYASEDVEDLRHLLVAGSQAERDPRRRDFYNLEGGGSTYYIHLSPITGHVLLLAKWSQQASDCYAGQGHLVA